MAERKLASIQKVVSVEPIEGAERKMLKNIRRLVWTVLGNAFMVLPNL